MRALSLAQGVLLLAGLAVASTAIAETPSTERKTHKKSTGPRRSPKGKRSKSPVKSPSGKPNKPATPATNVTSEPAAPPGDDVEVGGAAAGRAQPEESVEGANHNAQPGPGDDTDVVRTPDGIAGQADANVEAGEAAEETPVERPVAPLACLREDGAAEGNALRGVQRRDFIKKHRFQLSGLGGVYASDTLSSSYAYGGALTFYLGEEFGLEVMAAFLPMAYRLEEPLTGFDQERRFQSARSLALLGGLVFSPIHAKFKWTEEKIVHSDLFFVAGAGRTDHDSVQGLTWQVGIGIDLYLKQFLSLRMEVRDLIHGQEIFGRGGITNNIVWLVGLGLWLG